MRVSLSLLLTITLIFGVLLPALEAAATRRKGRLQKFRGGRSRSRLAFRQKARRGRQDEDVAEADVNAVDGEELGDEAMEELYNGCDWKTNIGGFLNFCKWRKWCADNQGITDFGPYGGVPASCPPEEEGSGAGDDPEAAASDDDVAEVEEAMEARRARARRGRKVAPKRKFRRTNKKASRKSKSRRNFRG